MCRHGLRSRGFMETIVQLKLATTPGDTRLPRAQGVCGSFLSMVYLSLDTPPVVYLKAKYTTDAHSPHVPRKGEEVAGARVHWRRRATCHGSYRGARTTEYSRRYVRSSCLRNACQHRSAGGVFKLMYTTTLVFCTHLARATYE